MKNLDEIIVGVKTCLVEKRISLSLKMLFEIPAEPLVETVWEVEVQEARASVADGRLLDAGVLTLGPGVAQLGHSRHWLSDLGQTALTSLCASVSSSVKWCLWQNLSKKIIKAKGDNPVPIRVYFNYHKMWNFCFVYILCFLSIK